MLKLLIADDHALMREGIHIVLDQLEREVQLVSAANYEDVFRCLGESSDFDLILIDLNMPGEESFSGLKKVLTAAGMAPVVVLSASENPADMQQSIELGVRGFISKSASNQVLVAALELVLSGGVYLPPQLFGYVGSKRIPNPGITNQSQPSVTRRQKEVLELIAKGEPNKEIGRTLGLSDGTVRTHVNAIFKLLDVNNRTQAGVRARALGLI